MKPSVHWIRSFWGKHPAFGDYLRINAEDRMFYAFKQWIDKGWANFEGRNSCSRFWVVPPNTLQLTCGMITTSIDNAGRPFPVLCAIKGVLPKIRGGGWDRINQYCRPAWRDMARIMGDRFDSVECFKEAFHRISPPDPDASCACADENRVEAIDEVVSAGLAAGRDRSIREKMLHFILSDDAGKDDESILWMTAIRKVIDVMPYSVFVQDVGGRKQLYLYYRPLTANDFRMMWNRE